MRRILSVGGALVALTLAGVYGSRTATAFAKDKREMRDPISRLPALRLRGAELGLATSEVPEQARQDGDAKPYIEEFRAFLLAHRDLAQATSGLKDSKNIEGIKDSSKLLSLVDKVISAKSYQPDQKLDKHSVFHSVDRTPERVITRVSTAVAYRDTLDGKLDQALATLDKAATFLGYLSDCTDGNGVIAWYGGVREVATAVTHLLTAPGLTNAQIDRAADCMVKLQKCPDIEGICRRMMNELVMATRGIDTFTPDMFATLNMNTVNTHDPKTDASSKEAMESGLLAYWTEAIDIARVKSSTPLERGLVIDKKALQLQKEDRVDRYMVRTISPTVFQLGQTITLANEINLCTLVLTQVARERLASGAYPRVMSSAQLTRAIDGCTYSAEYKYDQTHPAAVSSDVPMTNYDLSRHVSVEPSNGVLVNL